MAEEWRVIPGFEDYEVSDQGRVRNRISGKILVPSLDKDGYAQVNLRIARKGRTKKVHRLVLLAFIGPSDLTCNHKNGVRNDNRLENLEYLSRRDNLLYAIRVLRNVDRRGERNGHRKLTDEDIREIRRLLTQGLETRQSLAERYGVHKTTIDEIARGNSWKHVK